MNPARRIALEKALDWRRGAERLEQLDLGVRQVDKHHSHAVSRERLRF
jgi:hypothetical protein